MTDDEDVPRLAVETVVRFFFNQFIRSLAVKKF